MNADMELSRLARYFAGDMGDAERRAIEAWIVEDTARHSEVERLRAAWMHAGRATPAVDLDRAWGAIERRKMARGGAGAVPAHRLAVVRKTPLRGVAALGVPRRHVLTWSWVAAAMLVGVGLGAGSLFLWRHAPPPTLVAGRQYVAVPGHRMTIHLTDGSTVVLAPGSTLRTKPRFGVDVRDVSLEGEAYFDITHDAHMPFRVQTAQGFAEDIGTKFAVRAYAGATTSRVVVAEGKVAVGAGVILGAGDVALVTATAPPVIRHGVSVQHLLSWTTGQLEFVKTPLRDVVAELARWYGVEIRIDDLVLAQHPVTATFRDEPVNAVLGTLALIVGAQVEHRGAMRVLVPVTPSAVRSIR